MRKSQAEFLKFKDIKETLEPLGPQSANTPRQMLKNPSISSHSVSRGPLGLRMHKQAEIYNEHKQ